jgi:hypothetical protein
MGDTTMHGQRVGSHWAALSAPLVGVPLMVTLLAIGSGSTVDAAVEPEGVGFQVEQVGATQSDSAAEADALPSG